MNHCEEHGKLEGKRRYSKVGNEEVRSVVGVSEGGVGVSLVINMYKSKMMGLDSDPGPKGHLRKIRCETQKD